MMDHVYVAYKYTNLDRGLMALIKWKNKFTAEQPKFEYRYKVLEFELSVLNLVKLIR